MDEDIFDQMVEALVGATTAVIMRRKTVLKKHHVGPQICLKTSQGQKASVQHPFSQEQHAFLETSSRRRGSTTSRLAG
jgi:hypothetical protein